MSRRRLVCKCAHLQETHRGGVGRCACGCDAFRPRLLGGAGVEVLEVLDVGIPAKVAPLYHVRCRECDRRYKTRGHRREIATRASCRVCSNGMRLARKLTRSAPRRPAPGDLPISFAHGTRASYVSGCRCEPCTAANRVYARMRQKLARMGRGNPLVDAARVRRHLLRLSARGIGYKTVADVARVAVSLVFALRSGKQTQCRTETARRILAVTREAISDGHRVDAAATWRAISRLLALGYTRGDLAVRLGMKTKALKIGKSRINASTAHKVRRLYRKLCA